MVSKQNREQSRRARAAALAAQHKQAERRRRLVITGAIVAILVVVVVAGGAWLSLRGGSSDAAGGRTPQAEADGTSLVVGPDSAGTKVTVFEDFQCPFCRQFEDSSRDLLRKAALDGTAQVTYEPISILTMDDYSARALSAWATVLDKGTPAQALDFHDQLFEHQPYEDDAHKPDTDAIRDWAKDAGVTSTSVLDAIGPVDPGYVKQVNQAAVAAQVRQTPTVLVDGKPLPGPSVTDVQEQLEKALATD